MNCIIKKVQGAGVKDRRPLLTRGADFGQTGCFLFHPAPFEFGAEKTRIEA
ncbi:hypothetical protein B4096_1150 [Heyndrickxia coagulans]|nr:hypothetical protein B4096_1150 [Heyndrickxia coagulans]